MKRLLALGLVALATLPSAAFADVTDGSFALVDRPAGFGALPFDGASSSSTSDHAISANGCYVVFASNNDNLLPDDDDAFSNIYRRDRCSPGHPVALVSAASDGTPGNGESRSPSISADGRYVAFVTEAHNLDPAVLGASGNTVLVKDMNTHAIEVANRADGASGAVAPLTFVPVISGDGRHVVFVVAGQFDAANVDGVANGFDAYVRFLDTGNTYMASLTSTNGHDGSLLATVVEPGISFDGGSVAFVSDNKLAPPDTDQESDAYLVRGYTGSTPSVQLASYEVGNLPGSDSATRVALASDGKHIAWANDHVWFTLCDPNCGPDAQADGGSGGTTPDFTSLSFATGATAATAPTHLFWTNDRSLDAADTNHEQDMYSRDITGGGSAIHLLTTGTYAQGARGGSATDDEALVVFTSSSPELPGAAGLPFFTQTFARTGGQTTNISQPEGQTSRTEVGSSTTQGIHSISADGRFVAFQTISPYLGAEVVQGVVHSQAYVRDVVAGTTTPVSFTTGGAPANGSVSLPSIDAAGDRVVFASDATNLNPDVTTPNNRDHVYLHDMRTGATTLLDRNPSGAPLAEGAERPQISPDGTKVVFYSRTNELTPVTGGLRHVYELDVASGQFTLVDKTQGGTPGNSDATDPDIGGDRVAFLSSASNLGGNTAPSATDAYVKDLRTGVIFWASIPEDGSSGHSSVFDVALSGDGRRVAFDNRHAGFGYGADDRAHVYVRDIESASTTLASGGTGTAGSASGEFGSALSMDGTHVAFTEPLSNGLGKTWVRDLSANAPREIAPNARLGSEAPRLNADGTCVAFTSRSPDIVTPSFGPDYSHVYLRAMGANCPAGVPTGPVPPPTGQPPGTSDKTAPVISKLHVTNKRFALAKKRTAAVARKRKKVKRGTAFKFRLSEAARTTITIARKAPGRRKGKRCVKPHKGLKKHCTRYLKATKLTRKKTKRGANTVAFSGRVGKKNLKPGTYRATLVATDAAGNRSKPARVAFRVVRG